MVLVADRGLTGTWSGRQQPWTAKNATVLDVVRGRMGQHAEVQALVYVVKHRSDERAIVGLLLLKASDSAPRLPLGVAWTTRQAVSLHDASRERLWVPGQLEYEARREQVKSGKWAGGLASTDFKRAHLDSLADWLHGAASPAASPLSVWAGGPKPQRDVSSRAHSSPPHRVGGRSAGSPTNWGAVAQVDVIGAVRSQRTPGSRRALGGAARDAG